MKTYIRKTIKGYFVEFPEEIDKEYWEGKIGDTYEDFLDGKWILLTDEQVQFHTENPYASIEEILNIYYTPKKRTSSRTTNNTISLEETKNIKLSELQNYYNSRKVMTINKNIFNVSYSKICELKELVKSASIYLRYDRETLEYSFEEGFEFKLVIEDKIFTCSTEKFLQLERFLSNVTMYLNKCDVLFINHKNNILSLETLDQIEEYDYTLDFPNIISIEV